MNSTLKMQGACSQNVASQQQSSLTASQSIQPSPIQGVSTQQSSQQQQPAPIPQQPQHTYGQSNINSNIGGTSVIPNNPNTTVPQHIQHSVNHHYAPLNVPSGAHMHHHYGTGISGSSVPNSQPQIYNAPKSYSSYNMGQNQNLIPPVSQTLPPTQQQQQSSPISYTSTNNNDKTHTQSNGTQSSLTKSPLNKETLYNQNESYNKGGERDVEKKSSNPDEAIKLVKTTSSSSSSSSPVQSQQKSVTSLQSTLSNEALKVSESTHDSGKILPSIIPPVPSLSSSTGSNNLVTNNNNSASGIKVIPGENGVGSDGVSAGGGVDNTTVVEMVLDDDDDDYDDKGKETEEEDQEKSFVNEQKEECKPTNTLSSPTKTKEKETKASSSTKSPVTSKSTSTRKSKTPKSEEESPKNTRLFESKISTGQHQKLPSASNAANKTKRNRFRTQHYQSPLPEIEIITKISSTPSKVKTNDDKLIVFFKNEFLSVRNSEGGFYICQAVQNIYKSSSKIRIRWLSQDKTDKSGDIYVPDFYDHTDFDCILTNLNLVRVTKGRYKLPPKEKGRTDSILKRSLAMEKGELTISSPSLTEEHPDGIDVSIYKEESQLIKRRGTKRKLSSTRGKTVQKTTVESETPTHKATKSRKISRRTVTTTTTTKKPSIPSKKKTASTTAPTSSKRAASVKASKQRVKAAAVAAAAAAASLPSGPSTSSTTRASQSRTNRTRRKKVEKPKSIPVVDQKKARALAKVVRKSSAATTSTGDHQTTNKNSKVNKSQQPSTSKVQKTKTISNRKAKHSTRK